MKIKSKVTNTIVPNATILTSEEGKIVWGFMLENTLFTEFEEHNHAIIESAYRQRKSKQSSHYITIIDMNLPKPNKAKIYFGVVQNHLRMPGTRYYVSRRVIKLALPSPTDSIHTLTIEPNYQHKLPTQYLSNDAIHHQQSILYTNNNYLYQPFDQNSLILQQENRNNEASLDIEKETSNFMGFSEKNTHHFFNNNCIQYTNALQHDVSHTYDSVNYYYNELLNWYNNFSFLASLQEHQDFSNILLSQTLLGYDDMTYTNILI